MTIENAGAGERVKHAGLLEVRSVGVAKRIADDGSPQIGMILEDEDGDAFAVHVMSPDVAVEFCNRMLALVDQLRS